MKVGDLVYAPFFQTRGIIVRKWMDPGEKWEGYLYNMEILTSAGSLVEFCMYEDDEDEWEVLSESG